MRVGKNSFRNRRRTGGVESPLHSKGSKAQFFTVSIRTSCPLRLCGENSYFSPRSLTHFDDQFPGGLSSFEIAISLLDLLQRVDMLDPELKSVVCDPIQDLSGAFLQSIFIGKV